MNVYKNQSPYVKFYVWARTKLLSMDYYTQFLLSGTIVDIGCGYGVLSNYLSLKFPNSEVIGVDIDSKRIKSAIQTIGDRKNIKFIEQDITKWDWPTCSTVTMVDVLHHLSFTQQELVLRKISKKLVNCGVLFIAEVDPEANVRYWLSWLSDHILYPKDKISYRTTWEWWYLLKGLGFTVDVIRPKDILARVIYVCRKEL